MIKEHGLVTKVLDNLKYYCKLVNEKLMEEAHEDRKKLFLVNPKYSHHDEVEKRLNFVKYLASVTEFNISKVELGAIYDLLVV